VTSTTFQRARSADAKRAREQAILDAARHLAAERGIREITLTDVAAAVGMHKSALLRYFETREEIFLRLTADGWREWSAALCAELAGDDAPTPGSVAAAYGRTLAARGTFCDLLGHAPLNLERHVSVDVVREFKLTTHRELDAIVAATRDRLPSLPEPAAVDVVATAVALAGAFWQVATPGPEALEVYHEDPRLGHAVLEVGPRLERILARLLDGSLVRADGVELR
jgi:AcrR family transcriptional regulator